MEVVNRGVRMEEVSSVRRNASLAPSIPVLVHPLLDILHNRLRGGSRRE